MSKSAKSGLAAKQSCYLDGGNVDFEKTTFRPEEIRI